MAGVVVAAGVYGRQWRNEENSLMAEKRHQNMTCNGGAC